MSPNNHRSIYKVIGLAILLILVCVLVFKFCFGSNENFPNVPGDKWQAVFLDNNQVYFGKLADLNTKYVTLTSVFYLRAADSIGIDKASQNINLVKLGGEFHGPEDTMYISKDKILFWENLAPTSAVVKTILDTKR